MTRTGSARLLAPLLLLAALAIQVLEALAASDAELPVRCLGIPDRLIEHGDPTAIRASLGLDTEGIERAVIELLGVRS